MTAFDVVNKVSDYLRTKISLNSTFYVDMGNPEHLYKMREDQELLDYVQHLIGGGNAQKNH